MLSDPGDLAEVGTRAGVRTTEEMEPLLGTLLKSKSGEEKCPGFLLPSHLPPVPPAIKPSWNSADLEAGRLTNHTEILSRAGEGQ